MRYKVELTIMTLGLICLSITGVATAGGVVKTLYVDGNQIGQGIGPAPLSAPYTRLTIGAEGSAWYRYNEFAGKIDEFAVYNGVLNDANITAHYTAGPAGYAAAVLASNPRLYLRFEDANSDNNSVAFNSGSADVNGKYIDTVTLAAAGYAGKAAEFSGPVADANGDCIDVADEYTYLTLDNLTVEFWINTTQATEYPRLFQHNNGQAEMGGYGAMYAAATDAIGLIGGGDTDYVSVPDPNLNNGVWHHVVITFASTRDYATEVMADDPCAYLKFDNTLPVDSSVNRYVAGVGRDTRIDKTLGGLGRSLFIDANIVPDVCQEYAYVWNNYDGFYPPPSQWTVNEDYYAFTAGDVSFEIWIKSVPGFTPSQYAMIFQQMGAYTKEPNAPGLGLFDNDAAGPNVPQLRILGGSQWWYPGVNAPLDGLWHQLVVTYDENEVNPGHDMSIQFYLDGVLAGSTTVVDDVDYQALLGPELSHLMIGAENDQGWAYNTYSGYLDEFSIYPGVLSADRIATHYAAWQPGSCAEAIERGLGLQGDLDGDCDVDFFDYAKFASEWLLCNDPANPNCTANW